MLDNSFAVFGSIKQALTRTGLGQPKERARERTRGPESAPSAGLVKEGLITAIVYADKKWRVRAWGTEWFAESAHPFAFKVGDFVQVIGRISATTLLIDRKPS